jgi:hypothetical protein
MSLLSTRERLQMQSHIHARSGSRSHTTSRRLRCVRGAINSNGHRGLNEDFDAADGQLAAH